MTSLPSWLPGAVSVSPWTDRTFQILYDVFERDFKKTQAIYRGHPVWFFPEKECGRERIFWHLTHRDNLKTGERLPDLRRCERLPWVRKMIDYPDKPEVLAWDYMEADRRVKTYVWLKDHDFVVVMKKYPDGTRRLVTSFLVDYPHTRRGLRKKYSNRVT